MSRRRTWFGVLVTVGIAASQGGATETSALGASRTDAREVPEIAACFPDLPDPAIVITGRRFDPPYVRFDFAITNWLDFPNELFAPAPHLPPCGLNESAGRTWIDIYSPSGRLGGYCGSMEHSELGRKHFAVEALLCPSAVEISLTDRECRITYRSGPVPISCTSAVMAASWTAIKVLYQ